MSTALLEIESCEPWNASPIQAYSQAHERANIRKIPMRASLYNNIIATCWCLLRHWQFLCRSSSPFVVFIAPSAVALPFR